MMFKLLKVENVKKTIFDCLPFMSLIENPAFTILNNKHTLMVKDGITYVLVFFKQSRREAFVKCKASKDGIDILDRDNPIYTEFFDEFKQSKRIHPGLGINMFSI